VLVPTMLLIPLLPVSSAAFLVDSPVLRRRSPVAALLVWAAISLPVAPQRRVLSISRRSGPCRSAVERSPDGVISAAVNEGDPRRG
jgi:hypothetical protein